jgi:hypothetical protein
MSSADEAKEIASWDMPTVELDMTGRDEILLWKVKAWTWGSMGGMRIGSVRGTAKRAVREGMVEEEDGEGIEGERMREMAVRLKDDNRMWVLRRNFLFYRKQRS